MPYRKEKSIVFPSDSQRRPLLCLNPKERSVGRKKIDPLRKEEIETIETRRTEAVLRAVLRYANQDVATAVSSARKYLRDEEDYEVEDVDGLLTQDDIDFPLSVRADQRDARFGRTRDEGSLLSDDILIADDFVAGQESSATPSRLGEYSQSAKKRRIPTNRRVPQRSQPLSRREAREQERLRNQQDPIDEPETPSILPTKTVDDSAYDFLDEETNITDSIPTQKSLLVPEEDDFWDESASEEEEEIHVPTRATETQETIDEEDDEDYGDLWTLPEEDTSIPRKRSGSINNVLDQLGDLKL